MVNVLLQNQQSNQNNNQILNTINRFRSMGPSSVVFNQLYSSNPNFRAFADSLQGKSPEVAFSERGLDFNQFKSFKW